jgi:hypothetical protein
VTIVASGPRGIGRAAAEPTDGRRYGRCRRLAERRAAGRRQVEAITLFQVPAEPGGLGGGVSTLPAPSCSHCWNSLSPPCRTSIPDGVTSSGPWSNLIILITVRSSSPLHRVGTRSCCYAPRVLREAYRYAVDIYSLPVRTYRVRCLFS